MIAPRRWGPTARRRAVAAALACAVVTGCTPPPAPAPTPSGSASADVGPTDDEADGDRVAVIVGPESHVSPAEADALESAARAIAVDPPDGVVEVRVVRAQDAVFAADLVELSVDDGFDVVCVVGTGAATLLLRAARVHRAARLCGTDPAIEGAPANVVAVALDPVALTTLAAAAVRIAPPPVGLVAGPEVGGIDVVEPLLRSLLPTSPGGPGAPAATGPAADATGGPASPAATGAATGPPDAVVAAATADSTLAAAVETVAASASAAGVVLAPRSTEAVEALAAAGISSVVVDDWVRRPTTGLPGGALVAITVDRAAQLRAAIEAARAEEGVQVPLLRLGDGVLGVAAGSAPGAAAAEARAREALDAAAAG